MIVPVGKTRVQEAQGQYQNASILFNDDLLKKIAVVDIGSDKTQVQPPNKLPQTPQKTPEPGLQDDLNQTMNDSQSPQLNEKNRPNPAANMSGDADNKATWKFNPQTGEPLSHESFVEFYKKLQGQKAQWEQEVGPLDLTVKGNERQWQMILAPAANGGKITPGTGKGI